MALNYQKLDIAFKGLNEKADDKNLPMGEFTTLENLWMQKTGELEKRYGLTKTNDLDQISDGTWVADYNGKPVVFGDDRFAYANADGTMTKTEEKWIKGSYDITQWSGQLGVNDYIDYGESTDYGIGARLVTVDDGAGSTTTETELTFYDSSTKKPFYRTNFSSTKFKIAAKSDRIFVFYVGTSTITMREYIGFAVNGTPDYTQTTIQASDPGLNIGIMDAAADQGNDYVTLITAYQSTATSGRLRGYTYDHANSTLTTFDTSVGNKPTILSIGLDSTSAAEIAYYDFGLNYLVQYERLTYPNTLSGPSTILNLGGTGEDVDQLSITGSNVTSTRCFVRRPAATGATTGVVLEVYKLSGTWSLEKQLGNCRMASRAFESSSDAGTLIYFYLGRDYISSDRTNLGLVACKIDNNQFDIGIESLLPSEGLAAWGSTVPPPFVTIENNEPYTTVFAVNAGAENSAKIVTREYDNTPVFASWQFGLLNNVSPNLRLFDGVKNNAVGWPLYPKEAISIATAGSGSAYTAGDYGVRTCWVRYDADGNACRSAPSPVKSFTLAAGASGIDCEFEPYPFFDKDEDIEDTWLEVYRTEVDGGTYYLDGRTKIADLSYSSTYYDRIDYSFQLSDANLIAEPLLYTTGGNLEYIGPASCKSFTVSRERVWLLSSEDGRAWYSNARVKGLFPSFSDALILDYEGVSGLTAASTMDDKTVLFSADQIFVVYGVGPDSTGAGRFDVQEITTDVGSSQPRSIVHTSKGVYFMSRKGIYVLDRSLNTQFIGAKIEDQKSDTIVGAYETMDREQVWFVASNGDTQVYDEYHGIWYNNKSYFDTFYSSANVDAVPYFIGKEGSNDRRLLKEDSSSYTDELADYVCTAITGWLNFSGIQGFKKIREIMIIGDAVDLDGNAMNLTLYNDFSDTQVETFAAQNVTVGATPRYQWGVKPKVQKMEAIKLKIDFTTSDYGFKISAISFEAGMIPGVYRQASTRRVEGT